MSNSNNISRKDIDTYRTSTDAAEHVRIERKSLANDFDSDALDGWSDPALSTDALKRMDKRFKGANYSSYWFAGIVLTALIGLGIFLFNGQKSAKPKTVAQTVTIEKTDIVLPEAIEAMVELPKTEQITPKSVVQTFTNQQKSPESERTTPLVTPATDPLPLQTPELLIPETTLKRETISGKEIYLHDLKLLDYRAYRSRPSVTTKQMVLTGTPANVGDAAINGDEEPEWKDVEIPYIDYLEKTMELFAKGYNKKALSRFQTILEAYPDDVNAGFYAGICYYNLKEYDQAERSLRICINSKYSNFYEEAEWYLAKNLLAQGNRDKGVELLRAISNAKGYYAKQADAELKRLSANY
jgi:hypothetical protein